MKKFLLFSILRGPTNCNVSFLERKSTSPWRIQWQRSHNAINSTPPPGGGKKLSQEELEERQKLLMAKNLPKRKPIPGVKKVVLVASGKVRKEKVYTGESQ